MSGPLTRGVFRFGDFALDAAAYELTRRGQRVRLSRQPMELLLLLVDRPRELVSRDEIAGRLWPAALFGDIDAGIHTAILRIRQALGDAARSPSFVETVQGKGYRFVAPVEMVHPVVPDAAHVSLSTAGPLLRRHNLPAELTSFIGRRRELEELPGLLTSSRLLTLTGAGGVGKTRLAVRLASDLVNDFPDGAWMVDLGALPTPDLIAQTLAGVLGLRESPHRSTRTALADYLRDRTALLLVDTCEHVVGPCANLIATLLREAPQLRVVATSREALGIPGEVVYRVPSLSLPEGTTSLETLVDVDAARLFIDRACAIDPTFTPTLTNADTIVRICRRLDGIPLAIELAAARVAVLSPEQIESRLNDRFRLLTGGARTAVPRQRTLAATVDWSYQLLSDHERLLLNRLSVFPASWTLEAAEQICGEEPLPEGDTLDLLSRLVNKSLVVAALDSEKEHRYRLLDTVRDYARACLAEDDATERVRARHFAFVLGRFRDSRRVLRGPSQLSRLQQLRTEQENVRAALEWAFASAARKDEGAELAGAIFWYWTKCGLFEEGRLWLQQAIAVATSPHVRACGLVGLAHMHHFQGHQDRVAECGAEAVSLGTDNGDPWAVAVGWFLQALAAFEGGNLDAAHAGAKTARLAADLSGDLVEHGGPLMILANVALMRGNQEDALQLYDESIDVHRRAGDAWGLSILLSIAAGLRIVRHDFENARAQGSEALSLCQALEDPRGIAWSLEVFAGLLAAEGRHAGAARLWGLSDALLDASGGALTVTIGWIREQYIEPVTTSLGELLFDRARSEGRRMSVDQAIALIQPPAEVT